MAQATIIGHGIPGVTRKSRVSGNKIKRIW